MATASRSLTAAQNQRSLNLLFDILEQPRPFLSGAAMADFHSETAKLLIARGLLVRDGHEAVDYSGEDDGSSVALTWSEETQALGYFKPSRGWVTAATDRLTRYRVSPEGLAATVLQGLRAKQNSPVVVSDDIWNFGNLKIPYRANPVCLLLARRAHDPFAWRRIKKWLLASRSELRRILLCPSSSTRLPEDAPSGTVLISLRDLLGRSGFLRIDLQLVASWLDVTPAFVALDEPLAVIGDGLEVRLHGEVFRFPKGVNQRRIICALHERYRGGETAVSIAALVADLDLRSGRLRDYFGKSKPPVMSHLLWEKDGLCGFCLQPAPTGD